MAQDPIDRLLGLSPEDQRKALSALTPAALDIVRVKIKERKAKQTPAGPPSKTLMESRKAASKGEFEANRPAFEQPENASPMAAVGDVMIGAERAMGLDPMNPVRSIPSAALDAFQSIHKLLGLEGPVAGGEALRNLVTAPVQSVQRGGQAIREQNLPAAAQAVGEGYAQARPFVEGRPTGDLSIGDLRTKARETAQSLTGSNAFKTTRPLVEKYVEDAGKAAEKTAQNQKKTAGQLESNREITKSNARAESIDRSLQEGSKRLGERVKELDKKIRSEANEKYSTVRQAVANDPGVPLSDLAQAARHAETNILKGSAENIKQFRELARKSPEEEGLHTNVGDVQPGDPLYELLKSQGAIDTGGNIPFDQLQGYSSEIGAKLAKGGLPGDIYQALKYLKDKIDTAKTTIADRNGAGAALRNADSFWHSYMDLFYNSDSALTKVRESVGTLDPQYYADAFTKGKAGDVAIGKLKSMKTQHANEASGIADLARNLRSAGEERGGIKTGTVKPVEKPERVTAEPPTVEDITGAKKEKIQSKSAELMQLRRYDLIALGASVIGPLLGSWAREAGLAYLAGEKGFAAAMNRPAVIDWISRPTPADLAAIEKLPEPARAELTKNLKAIMDQERAAGRPLKVSPAVGHIVGGTASNVPKNRQEALDRLAPVR